MHAWPEPLRRLFARAAARLGLLACVRSVAAALLVSLLPMAARAAGLMSTPVALWLTALLVVSAGALAIWRAPRHSESIAAQIESRTPVARNLLVTAAELTMRQRPIRADVREVVLRDAADVAGRIDLAALFPLGRAALVLVAAAAAWAGAFTIDAGVIARAREVVGRGVAGAPTIHGVAITVTPPAYSGRPVQRLTDPERIDALAGSRIHVEVDATAEHVDLVGVGERHALARDTRAFAGDVTATTDGFLAVQPFGAADAAGVRRVMTLAVVPDRSPVARITAPGKDLFLSSAMAALPVRIDASDDLGLTSLRLTFTKVTGSGENFEFANGEFPLQITRDNPQAWAATASIPLSSLGLEPGDVLVYRAVVGDNRPGGEPIDSDAFVIEIVRPGDALAEGFSIDEEKDKYALSQQMIIIKTERLLAKKSTVSAAAFADEAQTIAAEQRRVRAEFVFMMGGEFEDATADATGDINEEEEAANEVELMAGRMQNNGRRDIILATRYMSDAAQLLTNVDPVQALPREKSALVALQRAFTKSRYILRVLTPRERIDDSRRLSGKLGDVSAWRRQPVEVPNDPRTTALLAALSRVGRVASLTAYGPVEANELAGIAETILRADGTLALVAQSFAQAGSAIAASKPAAETAALIDAAAAKLAAAARVGLPAAPPPSPDASQSRLRGALADATPRKGGGR